MSSAKVIALFSGGLDSTLAARMMLDQGLEVVGFHMTSPFCTCTPKKSGCANLAASVAKQMGIRIVIQAKGNDYLDLVRNPRFGHGRGLNPCVDCRIYLFQKAKELMRKEGAQAIVTGEVLGQRPMSQRMAAMRLIEQESGLQKKVLRPLSAKLLPETELELRGVVDRAKLVDIAGRQRRRQLDMADEHGIEGFSCGTGGCLLTDPHMKARLVDLFEHKERVTFDDVRRLKFGRHFRLENGVKFILGRNQEENERLCAERKADEALLVPADFAGPSALVEALCEKAVVSFAANVMCAFSKTGGRKAVTIEVRDESGPRQMIHVPAIVDFNGFRISKK